MTRPDLGVIVRQPGLLPADRSLGPYHLEPLIQPEEIKAPAVPAQPVFGRRTKKYSNRL